MKTISLVRAMGRARRPAGRMLTVGLAAVLLGIGPGIVGRDARGDEAGRAATGEQAVSAEHDHATGHPENGEGLAARLVSFAGAFHPMAVHLPIAMVLGAALAELLAMVSRKPFYEWISRFNISLAALGVIVAVLFGLAAGAGADYVGAYRRVLSLHKLAGLVTGGLILSAAAASGWAYRDHEIVPLRIYRLLLLLCVAGVSVTGFLGGRLVYGLEHYRF